jgi:hypothetical protein
MAAIGINRVSFGPFIFRSCLRKFADIADALSRSAGYIAAVGQETLDIELSVDLASGRIVRATLDNPVETVVRDCADPGLTDCGEPRRRRILRRVECCRPIDRAKGGAPMFR